ncbi:MAG TPA: dihydroneopterin aldolase, partial [Saprospiraceae bacterium]|nr:dihydroneopterin aldolase [Saprospiraceae bacterium]
KVDARGPLGLKDTIDYQDVYRLIAAEMARPQGLLENLALTLVNQLKTFDSRILGGRIRIRKNPQLGGPLDGVSIALDF